MALATGMAWLAHGSDMGGSLRSPASFCGVVGMRPSPGRVAASVVGKIDGTLGQEGPMARNVTDLCLLLDAMSGFESGDPLSLPKEKHSFSSVMQNHWKPKRVAFSRDLGITPVDPEVAAIVEAAARKLEASGVVVEEAHPDLREAMECFQTLRALGFATGMHDLLLHHRDELKADVIWNIEKGLALNGGDIAKAERQRGRCLDLERQIRQHARHDRLLDQHPAMHLALTTMMQRLGHGAAHQTGRCHRAIQTGIGDHLEDGADAVPFGR